MKNGELKTDPRTRFVLFIFSLYFLKQNQAQITVFWSLFCPVLSNDNNCIHVHMDLCSQYIVVFLYVYKFNKFETMVLKMYGGILKLKFMTQNCHLAFSGTLCQTCASEKD